MSGTCHQAIVKVTSPQKLQRLVKLPRKQGCMSAWASWWMVTFSTMTHGAVVCCWCMRPRSSEAISVAKTKRPRGLAFSGQRTCLRLCAVGAMTRPSTPGKFVLPIPGSRAHLCAFVHIAHTLWRNAWPLTACAKVGVSILVERDGKMLLVKRGVDPGRGQWCLPSGFIEWDESPQAAAVRECLEETGLAVENLILLEATHYTDDFRGAGINLTFQGQVNGGSLRAGDDASVARFFVPDELPPMEAIAFDSHRLALERWRTAHAQADDSSTTRNGVS
jgi:8-oxo-dGTP diphosphatase